MPAAAPGSAAWWRRGLPAALAGMVLGLLLRLPGLQTWPAWTDETGEVAAALAIAFEGQRPLVHNDSYRGPLWAYLLALCLKLLGPQPWLPRAFALAIGVLTVGVAALLAARLAGRRAALPAALLSATAFAPTVFFSHIAWSNHLTPLAVALALLVSAWALGWPLPDAEESGPHSAAGAARAAATTDPPAAGRHGPWSAARGLWAGLTWGLALQTHPSALPALVGLGAWLAWCRLRAALPRRAGAGRVAALEPARAPRLPGDPVLARALVGVLLGLALGLAPLLAHNALAYLRSDRQASVVEATAEDQPINRDLGPARLAANLLALGGQLGRAAVAGPPWEAGDPRPSVLTRLTDVARPVATGLAALLLLGGLLSSARRPGLALLSWPAGASLLLLPLINRSYLNIYDARYLGSLLLLAQVATGAWLADGSRSAAEEARGAAGADGLSGRSRQVRARLAALALAFLGLYPLSAQAAYAERVLAAGRDNRAIAEACARLVTDRRDFRVGGGTGTTNTSADALGPILIAKALRDLDLGGGGDPARAFAQQLRLSGESVEQVKTETLNWYLDRSPGPLWLLQPPDAPAPDDWKPSGLAEGPGWRALRLERAAPAP